MPWWRDVWPTARARLLDPATYAWLGMLAAAIMIISAGGAISREDLWILGVAYATLALLPDAQPV